MLSMRMLVRKGYLFMVRVWVAMAMMHAGMGRLRGVRGLPDLMIMLAHGCYTFRFWLPGILPRDRHFPAPAQPSTSTWSAARWSTGTMWPQYHALYSGAVAPKGYQYLTPCTLSRM
jgi:hypothetical protein